MDLLDGLVQRQITLEVDARQLGGTLTREVALILDVDQLTLGQHVLAGAIRIDQYLADLHLVEARDRRGADLLDLHAGVARHQALQTIADGGLGGIINLARGGLGS